MFTDRMEINHEDGDTAPDYGSLYLRHSTPEQVNDYGGALVSDVSKLTLITNCAAGSTCIFNDGSLYIKNFDGTWSQFAGTSDTVGSSQTAASTNSLNFSPLNIGRNVLLDNADVQENELEYVGDETGEELEAIEVEPGEFGTVSSDMR